MPRTQLSKEQIKEGDILLEHLSPADLLPYLVARSSAEPSSGESVWFNPDTKEVKVKIGSLWKKPGGSVVAASIAGVRFETDGTNIWGKVVI